MRRRLLLLSFTLVVALVASWQFASSSGAARQANRDNVTVTITGTETFLPSGVHATFRFPAAATKVHAGGLITFDNQTNDGHTMTLVAATDVPKSFNCPICDQVNSLYFPGNGPPAGFNIDNGVISDDTNNDADASDTNGFPIEDFDTPTHSGPSAVGDSTLVDANGSNNGGGPTTRVVQVTAPVGTTLEYICTFHPWMQGTIIVTG